MHTDKAHDDRGYFARIICADEFRAHELPASFVQSSISYNRHKGTFRGMHFQWPPSREGKLVRCTRGRVLDLILDLRPDSPTFLQHASVELDEQSANAIFIPAGFAHGFQTQVDETTVQYHMTDVFQPDLAAGFRWNDPAFGLALPLPVSVISARDAEYSAFDRSDYVARYNGRAPSSGTDV